MNSCDAKGERLGLAALTTVERTVVLVSSANFEISLGGLSGFYYNSAGDRAAETVAALEAVGATRAAAALRAANALFPGGAPARDRTERYEGWRALMDSEEDVLSPLNQEFDADQPDLFARLCDFIDAHAADLRDHGPEA
jgi:hypothetical protein